MIPSDHRYWLIMLLIAAGYVGTALLGFQFASINNNVTLIWLPAGVALAALLHFGYRYWPAIFIGATIANLLSKTHLLASLSIAVGNTTEILVACWLIHSFFKYDPYSTDSVRNIIGFILTVIFSALLAALNGATVLALQVFDNWDAFYSTLGVWWLGDAMGMLLITPALLIWTRPPWHSSYQEYAKGLLMLSLVMFSVLITFGGIIEQWRDINGGETPFPLAFLPMAVLLTIALFSGPKLISLAILLSTGLTIFGTLSGNGPFVRSSFEESIALIYLYIAISTIGTYTVSYLLNQRNLAQEELQVSSNRFDYVMRATEDGVWDWNVLTNEVYYSPSLIRMLGYQHGEFPAHFFEWRKRIHPDDKKRTLEALYAHRDRKTPTYRAEYRLACKGGDYIWILGRGRAVQRDSDGIATRMVGTHVNLSAQKEREAKMELAARVIENTPEAIMITSAENTIIDVNPAFTHTTGYTRDEAIGNTPSLLSSGRHSKAFYQQMWGEIEKNGFWRGEVWNRRKSGEIYPEWLHISAITDSNNNVMQYVAIFSDLAGQEKIRHELHNFAYYDALTQLPNRDLFLDRLNITLQQARKNRTPCTVLLIDLDRFKVINETLGHSVGDALLQGAAEILTAASREGDTVARMGGDEFAVLLPNTEKPKDVARTAEAILNNFTQPFKILEHELHITCSIGISSYPQDGESAEELLKNAETSMYKAKEEGFNRYRFYQSEMSSLFHEKLMLENHLRSAIERDELFIEYQPQHDIATMAVIGMEALTRWNHPEFGVIPPSKFIPIAEETGLIDSIGEWTLKQAIKDTASIYHQLPDNFRVAINLSVRQLVLPDLAETIDNALHQAELSPQCVELEITESMLMSNIDSTLTMLTKLANTGINIAIDDFGTGYSSLSYLKKFPVSKLKIDKSFIDEVCYMKDDAEIATTIITMGHNLNMKVIAEGVEDAKQLQFLKDADCNEAQGYHLSCSNPDLI